MDLRLFYQKVRQLEASITEPIVVIVSKETPDGGRAGVLTEVTRGIAARLVAEGKAELASEEVTKEFRARVAEAMRKAEEAAEASRIQIRVVSEPEMRVLKGAFEK